MTRDSVLRSGIAAIAVFLTVNVAQTPAHARSTSPRHVCPTKARIVLANSKAEIYEAEEPAIGTGAQVNACLFSTGRINRLGHAPGCGAPICGGVTHKVLSGTVVAYESFVAGTEEGVWYVVVRDLRNGRLLHHLPSGTPLTNRPNFTGVGPVEGQVVKPNGSVAWIAEDRQRATPATATSPEVPYYDVHAADKSGTRLLAAGADVNRYSLALAGNTVYWTQGNKPASAQLN
jgi:hypothetical protein